MLEFQLSSLDGLSDDVKSEYTERDGVFYLSVNGAKSNTDFDNMAEALKKRNKEAMEKIKGLENASLTSDNVAEIFRTEFGKIDLTGGGGGGGGGGTATDQQVHDLTRENAALKEAATKSDTEKTEAVQAKDNLVISSALTGAIALAGPRPEVLLTVSSMSKDYFEITDDGKVVSKVDCEFGPNLSPTEIFSKMKIDPRFAPFWPDSKGGGADGAGGGGGGGADDSNPWTKAGWNKTKQGEVVARDQAEAEKMAKAAGSTVFATHPPEK